jgi:hypothetical protein
MIRSEAESGEPELHYKVEEAEGTAEILATPPKL